MTHTLPLPSGAHLPVFGLGTWPMDDAGAARAVATAIESGYRLIDTAENYANERGVGQGIRDAGVPRHEMFVTTKFNKKWHSVAGAREACEQSLERLGIEYLDLLLVHWPNPDQGTYVDAVRGIAELQAEGLVRDLGTSNFDRHHLQDVLDAGLQPAVNQIQCDPTRPRRDLVAFDRDHGIITQAWRPLGGGAEALAELPAVVEVAGELDCRPEQVLIAWQVAQGHSVIAKSADPQRQRDNLAAADLQLSDSQLAALDALADPSATVPNADTFGH